MHVKLFLQLNNSTTHIKVMHIYIGLLLQLRYASNAKGNVSQLSKDCCMTSQTMMLSGKARGSCLNRLFDISIGIPEMSVAMRLGHALLRIA